MTLYAEASDGTLIAYDVHSDVHADTEGAEGAEGVADAALPTVLLIHGFAAEAQNTWIGTGWVRALERAGRRMITLDLRGHGRSDQPLEGYEAMVQAADVRAVLDSAAVATVDVVAYSMGTRVASALAQLAPERVRRLVLGGTGPLERFATWDVGQVERMLRDGTPTEDPGTNAVLGRAIAEGYDAEVLLACIRGISRAPLMAPDGIPVLFVAAEEDDVTEGAEGLARDWGASFVTIPGRDHINVLTSRTFKDAVIGFLA